MKEKMSHWDALNEIWRKLDKYHGISDEEQEWFDIVSNALERLDKLEKEKK